MHRRHLLAVLAGGLATASSRAGLLDWFNGVGLGQQIEIPPLRYLAQPPGEPRPLTLWYFWATWCEPCRSTLPVLNGWLQRHPDLQIVAVTDEAEDPVRAFMGQVPMQMPVALDTGRALLGPLRIRALPYAMLLDRRHRVVWRGQPKDLAADELQALLRQAAAPA